MKPTPQQQTIAAAFLETDQPLFVQARAGTGKTSTMELLVSAMPGPARVSALCCAFNKPIAVELERRFQPLGSRPATATLNALGHRLLIRHLGGQKLNVDSSKMLKLAKKLSIDDELFMPALELAEWAKHNNALPTVEALSEAPDITDGICPTEAIDPAITLLEESHRLALQGEIDFDDQLYVPLRLGLSLPRYSTIFVDEAQDLNRSQLDLLLTAIESRTVFFGDPAQAIYGFRGALPGACETIIATTKAEVLPLTVSFRCPRRVIQEAQAYVPDIEWRPDAPAGTVLRPDSAEPPAFSIASKKTFILCRYNAPIIGLALSFLRQQRPFTMRAPRFERSFAGYVRKLRGRNKKMPHELLLSKSQELANNPKFHDFHAALTLLCSEAPTMDPLDSLKKVLDSNSRLPEAPMLSTIHGAKGLEADRVIYYKHDVLYWQKGESPAQEEKNLAYVAITRSQDELIFF